MEQKDIIALDPLFDFTKACKRNYCTLVNVSICKIDTTPNFTIDGNSCAYYVLYYREWQNPVSFLLQKSPHEPTSYWTTIEKAQAAFSKIRDDLGLEELEEKEAFNVALLHIEFFKKIRKN